MTDPKTSAAVKSTEEKRRILEEMLRRRAGESRSYPLSFAQQRLWFLDRMEPESAAYVLVSALRLEGRLRRDALEGALRALAARHASLRTTFSTVGGEPVQVVAPAGDLPLAFEDLSAFPEEERRERVLDRLAAEAARPFDLARGPLVRATLLRVSEEEHALSVAMHHVVTDGWSMGVLFGELAALYDAAVAGLDAGLPPLPVQYPDYAAWQRKHLAGEALERQLAWWRETLAGAPALLHLPTDRPRPPVPSQRGGHHPVTVPAALTDRLRALAHGESATLFMVVLAAFGALLARWTGEEELVVGTPVAGRTRPELEGLIGFFVNTLALRADLSGDPPFRELLRRTREATLGAFSHQDVPFEKLVEELRVERSLSHSPLFQVMFTLQSGAAGAPAMTGLRTAALRAPVETARFDLELSLWEHPGGMQGVLGYAADLFDDATAGRMVEHLGVLLESAAADPDARLSRLAVLPGAERRRLLVEWNDTARPYSVRPVHELVAAQAAATPHAVALVAGDAHLTYAGLDARASRLAARLRAAGVGPEVPVGVCLERGPDMLAAVLGVLKAGGAYVPLDPEYPAERLRFVLEDAGVRVLVTEEGVAGRVEGFEGTVVYLGPPHPRPLPHKGGGEHDNDVKERSSAPSRANEFAATTAQSPPSRTDGNDPEALPQNWGRVASPSEPGGGAATDASSVYSEHDAVLPSPLVGEGPGVGGTRGAPEPAPVDVSPDNLAYVVYTSGSTGAPKGVRVEHRSLANTLLSAREAFGLEACDVTAVVASYAFDIWAFEALLPLTLGGMLRIVPRERVLDPEGLVEELEGVSVVHAVPALMRQVAAAARARGGLPRMRRVFVGGDAVPPDLVPEIRAAFPSAGIHVLYGPTEAAIFCAAHRVAPDETVDRNLVGAPLANARAYVLDGAGEPVPTGVPGELYVGGAGVARDYLRRPELTAERFVPDPFGGGPGARLYRTGDRARRLADGTLEWMGRTDRQVKVRGFRVEPGEVESALAGCPGVRDAAVVAREDAPGETRLVGYVTPGQGAGITGAEARAWLRERLPEHLVPAEVLVLDAFPLTPTGKTDRRALPAPGALPAGRDGGSGAPRTPTEEVVAGIWAEVLRLPHVGMHDGFFDLGGHSLLATQVVARVRAAFRVDVPVRALFEAPTVAGLAERVDAAVRAGQGISLPPLVPIPRGGPLPLSFAQERLWVIDRLDPGSAAYNLPVLLRMRGKLDVDALRAALEALVERHESLRTVLPAVDGRPVQTVLPAAPLPLPVEAADGEAGALRRAQEEAWRPFDLAEGPLFRAALLRVADDDHVLVLAQHHVVSDGWSVGVLLRELAALYGAFAEGREPDLPPLPVQYADYAAWQRGWLAGETLERQVAYWRERLAGAPALLDLPTDRPRRARRSPPAAHHALRVPREVLDALRALGRREGATPFMALLAAFKLLLAKHAGEEDVVVGTPIAGRGHEALEGTVGFFVNTLALRTGLGGDPTFRELLGRVRETTLGAYAHADLPFEKLVDEIRPERDLTHAPVFQVMFSLQNLPSGELRLPGLTLSPVETATRTAKFDLTLSAAETPEGLLAGLEYDAERFDAPTIERMAARFVLLLERVAAAPDARVSSVSLLDGAERAQLEAWSATGREPARTPVHRLVEENARRAPGAVAVRSGGEVLTYADLDRLAGRLAGRLRGLGVGPEARVGVALDRGPERAVAVLATLEAGGAYVPLDPSYPAERLAFMLEDAGVSVLLTEERLVGRLPEFGGETVLVEAPLADAPELPVEPIDPDSLAYVVYTSGSTGRPKGVMVTHGGLAAFVAAAVEVLRLGPDDVTPALSSFAFDIWVIEVLCPLAAGGEVRPVPYEHVVDPGRLAEELEGVTTLFTVPALLRQAAAAVRAGTGGTLPRMRQLFSGGDVVSPELMREAREAFPAAGMVVMYGPTEATVAASGYRVGGTLPERSLIGGPLAGATLHVCDEGGEPVPAGVPGELRIGGAGVARGYVGSPDLTAAAFVPDPFSGRPGARLYRTGDRVRWGPDGQLEFLGRVDRQAKVRGFRVEPGEIEAVLGSHPGVREAAVAVREDAPGDRRIVAYVVPGSGASGDELRGWLRERLPEHMVPAAFVALDRLPLTPSGKTDRRALPAPEGTADDAGAGPRTEMEKAVARVWEEVLGVRGVGTGRSFFDLGGNSLLVVRAASALEAALGRPVAAVDLFRHSTVAALARHLSGDAEEEPAPARAAEIAKGRDRLGRLLKRRPITGG